jgi:hypothetical protein
MRLVSKFPFLLNLCFIFVGYFGWVQGLQNESNFLAINFPVSIQWYSSLIEQCHCSWSIVKGQLNSSIDKAPSHSAETENLQQEDSNAKRIACGQGSSEPKQKRRKASTHFAVGVQNVGAVAPLQIGSNAYPAMWGSQASTWMPPGRSWMQPQGSPWMQQQGGRWVMPGPQYMQPPPMVEAHMQTQLVPYNIGRGSQIRKHSGVDQVVQERTTAGRKSYTLRVKAGGEIAGGCPGKNAWDTVVRTSVPRTLDMSILSWKEQSPDAIVELRKHLDRDFKYVGYHLTEFGFRNTVKRFMKLKHARLKR